MESLKEIEEPGTTAVLPKAMKQRSYILEQMRSIKPSLQRDFPLQRLALFGSWARDEQSEASDVDILVEVDPSIGLRFVELAERLEGLLDRKSVV